MLSILKSVLPGIFTSKSQKDVAAMEPRVQAINALGPKMQGMSLDELRAVSARLRDTVQQKLKDLRDQMQAIRSQLDSNPQMDLGQKAALYEELDTLEKQENERIEGILDQLLEEAFALIRETARRFKHNEILEVTASEFDRELATTKEYVQISGEKAHWKNRWMAAGNEVVWDMVHYDVQLIGGMVLHSGKIAEMATGEGKTLVATLPAFLNALAGKGVHIVTVNDYLARRDSEWMAPIFEFHGIGVDCVDKYAPHSEDRKKAYRAGVTYGTNNEFGFDYLRDNMVREGHERVQIKHHYAMVDEVDSVLIDEARTPLIISGPVPKGDQQEFHALKPRIEKLVRTQRELVTNLINEAKKLMTEGKDKEAGLALLRAHRGLPKNKALIKYLSETGIKSLMQKTENFYLQDNAKEMPKADEPLYFVIDEKNNTIELTEKGIELITESGEDPHFFVMPDVGASIAEIERRLTSDEEKLKEKDALLRDFGIKSERLHTINQLLKAYTLFEKDIEYIIDGGKVKIVDEQTGRVMEGRRYSDGLHQAIEAKENVKIEAATQTYATITLQNYFRMYHKLAGMTGTAQTEAQEFWEIYKLDVVEIPTNKPIVRKDHEDLVYKTKREKYNAVIEEIVQLREKGRPILVGTTSVEVSELLSRMLQLRKIPHNVLNAKQHQREAEVVAEAGKAGTVTIATNMAGRGTDIKLGPGVVDAGGLAIVGTERHESRRVDRQLRGRSGRQGDPGSTQFFVSLEDDLMRLFMSERIASIMDRLGHKEGDVIQHSMVTRSIERAQKKVEENNFGIRKRLLEYDNVMNSQREVIYNKRKNALDGERLDVDLEHMLEDTLDDVIQQFKAEDDFEGFKLDLLRLFQIQPELSAQAFRERKPEELHAQLVKEVKGVYERKNQQIAQMALPVLKNVLETQGEQIKNVVVPFTDGVRQLQVPVNLEKAVHTEGREVIRAFERGIALAIMDDAWKEHLREMDDLKQSVQNAVYEQKDPLLIYKFEAFELFQTMVRDLNHQVVSFLWKGVIPAAPAQGDQVQAAPTRQAVPDRVQTHKEEHGSYGVRASAMAAQGAMAGAGVPGSGVPGAPVKAEPVRSGPKVGRNDPCPCGSGKKYKQCHGKNA